MAVTYGLGQAVNYTEPIVTVVSAPADLWSDALLADRPVHGRTA